MTSVVERLANNILKALQAKDPDLEACRDLVDRLVEEFAPCSNLFSPDGRQKLLRTLVAVSKSLRLVKRSNLAWSPLLGKITSAAEQLRAVQHSPPMQATAAPSAETSSRGLPRTVHEYHGRLKRQHKEIYKNPPALPPASVSVHEATSAPPKRVKATGALCFEPSKESDPSSAAFIPQFRPNLTPEEILRAGAFGGTYFRPIESAVTNERYQSKDVLMTTVKPEWIRGLDPKLYLTSSAYRTEINKYGVKCGGSLGMWESSGWISDVDPYGWFQWYCRFYQGRRCSDDGRQISRWLGVAGSTGRFRTQLCNKILMAGATSSSSDGRRMEAWKDASVSPVIRQTLHHWGLEITAEIVEQHRKRKGSR